MVFLRHLNECHFILHYPCCKAFILNGFCAKCLVHRTKDCVDADTGDLFPYLLYVGTFWNDDINCLSDVPVCHIDEEVAWRLLFDLVILKLHWLVVIDTCGQSHRLNVYCMRFRHRLCDALTCYILSGRRFSYMALRPPPRRSHLNLTVQHLRTLERRAREMDIVCEVLMSRKATGERRKKWSNLDERKVAQIHEIQSNINLKIEWTLRKIEDEDGERLLCVESALK